MSTHEQQHDIRTFHSADSTNLLHLAHGECMYICEMTISHAQASNSYIRSFRIGPSHFVGGMSVRVWSA